MTRPVVTVVVPTRRRPAGLAAVLGGLARVHEPGIDWDVVVVDNDDPPGSTTVFGRATDGFPVPARLERETRTGASHARNRGIAAARGEIVVFLDDDVVPSAEWLRALVEPILAGRADGTGGRVALDPAVHRPRWLGSTLAAYLTEYDLGDDELALSPPQFVLSANAAFRAELLRQAGGFDTTLGPRAGVQLTNDDVGLSWRFMEMGGRLHYVPFASVVHELPAERLRMRYLLHRTYSQGRSDWLVERERLTGERRQAAGRALRSLGNDLVACMRAGPWRPQVVSMGACNVARTAGFLREAARR